MKCSAFAVILLCGIQLTWTMPRTPPGRGWHDKRSGGPKLCEQAADALGNVLNDGHLLVDRIHALQKITFEQMVTGYVGIDLFDPDVRRETLCKLEGVVTTHDLKWVIQDMKMDYQMVRVGYGFLTALMPIIRYFALAEMNNPTSSFTNQSLIDQLNFVEDMEATELLEMDPQITDFMWNVLSSIHDINDRPEKANSTTNTTSVREQCKRLANDIRKLWNHEVERKKKYDPEFSTELRHEIRQWTGIKLRSHKEIRSMLCDLMERAKTGGLEGIKNWIEEEGIFDQFLQEAYHFIVEEIDFFEDSYHYHVEINDTVDQEYVWEGAEEYDQLNDPDFDPDEYYDQYGPEEYYDSHYDYAQYYEEYPENHDYPEDYYDEYPTEEYPENYDVDYDPDFDPDEYYEEYMPEEYYDNEYYNYYNGGSMRHGRFHSRHRKGSGNKKHHMRTRSGSNGSHHRRRSVVKDLEENEHNPDAVHKNAKHHLRAMRRNLMNSKKQHERDPKRKSKNVKRNKPNVNTHKKTPGANVEKTNAKQNPKDVKHKFLNAIRDMHKLKQHRRNAKNAKRNIRNNKDRKRNKKHGKEHRRNKRHAIDPTEGAYAYDYNSLYHDNGLGAGNFTDYFVPVQGPGVSLEMQTFYKNIHEFIQKLEDMGLLDLDDDL